MFLSALASGLAGRRGAAAESGLRGRRGQAASPWAENVWGEPRPAYALGAASEPHGGQRGQRVTVHARRPRADSSTASPSPSGAARTYRGRVWLRSPDQARVQVLMRRSGPHYEWFDLLSSSRLTVFFLGDGGGGFGGGGGGEVGVLHFEDLFELFVVEAEVFVVELYLFF